MKPEEQNSPDWELLRRLSALYSELKQEERNFQERGNDEGECATYAAAERLREVVNGYMAEQSDWAKLSRNSKKEST